MCQVLQNKSVEDLARLVKEYAGSVQRNLDNPHVAHDYMSDLSLYVDELRERLYHVVCDDN